MAHGADLAPQRPGDRPAEESGFRARRREARRTQPPTAVEHLEAARVGVAAGVGMQRDEGRGRRLRRGESLVDRNVGVVAAGEEDVHAEAGGELRREQLRHGERHVLFEDAPDAGGAWIAAAVAGVDDDERGGGRGARRRRGRRCRLGRPRSGNCGRCAAQDDRHDVAVDLDVVWRGVSEVEHDARGVRVELARAHAQEQAAPRHRLPGLRPHHAVRDVDVDALGRSLAGGERAGERGSGTGELEANLGRSATAHSHPLEQHGRAQGWRGRRKERERSEGAHELRLSTPRTARVSSSGTFPACRALI